MDDGAIFASTNDRNHCQTRNREATGGVIAAPARFSFAREERERARTIRRETARGDADNDVVTYAQA